MPNWLRSRLCYQRSVAWLEWAVERQVGCGVVVARTMDPMDHGPGSPCMSSILTPVACPFSNITRILLRQLEGMSAVLAGRL